MRFSTNVLLLVLAQQASVWMTAESFSLTTTKKNPSSFALRRSMTTTALFSSDENSVEALREAAAKAREEANRLSQELGKDVVVAEKAPKKSSEELASLVPTVVEESDLTQQLTQWSELKDSDSITKFGQANLRTFPVSLSMLEQRTGITMAKIGLEDTRVDLDDFKYATLYVLAFSAISGVASLALLPPNVGATLCYFFALLPIVFLGIGSTVPGLIADVIARLKNTETDANVDAKERICRHEAAHFCCGYWCGLPVTGYSVEEGVARVTFGVAGTKFTPTEVAALSITALSGLVAEALAYDRAEGAAQDLVQLEQVFRQSQEFMGAAAQQDLTRWGAFTASQLLQTNAAKYEQVVQAFRDEKSVADCILLLES